MGMFSKLVAFLDKAAGVPAWITHADNIRKLEERGCPLLAKAIVENPSFHHMGAYTIGQIAQQLAEDYKGVDAGNLPPEFREFSRGIAREVIAASEGPVEGPLQVLYDFVGKDTSAVEIVEVDAPSSLAKFAEEVFAASEDTSTAEVVEVEEEAVHTPVDTSTAEVVEVEEVATTSEDTPTAATSTEEVHIPVLDPHVRAQTIREMTKVISRGRKATPTLKVLNTMSGGDRAAILEALHIMEARGNSLAKAILEDSSL